MNDDLKTQCLAKTKNGKPCQISAVKGQKYCHVHLKQNFWRRIISVAAICAMLLGVIGFIANITGILGYFDIKPFFAISPTFTPSAAPTPTKTPITDSGLPCVIEMNNDGIFADLGDIYAVFRSGALEVEPHFLNKYIALDSGCAPLSFFTIVVMSKLVSGDSENDFCLVFGPEPPQAGILDDNYVFCANGNKNWGVGVIKNRKLELSQKDDNEVLHPMGEENMLIVRYTPDGVSFFVNGAPVGSLMPSSTLKKGNYFFGFGVGTSTELPKWVLTSLKVYHYDKEKSSPWQGFSSLSQSQKSSLTLITRPKQQQMNLSISTPITLNYPVATYILMDTSASMALGDKYNLRQAIVRMILESAPPDDLIGLGLFNNQVTVIIPPTTIRELDSFQKIEESVIRPEIPQGDRPGTDYVAAIQKAMSDLEQTSLGSNGMNRRILLITDGGIVGASVNNSEEQKNDLLNVFFQAKQKGINIDVILVGDQLGNKFREMWRAFGEVNVANQLHEVRNPKDVSDIVLKQYYYSHTYDNSDNRLLLNIPSEYEFNVMPNVDKMAMAFTGDIKYDQPFELYLVSPDQTQYAMYAGSIISVSKPLPGKWKIVLSGNAQEQIEVQSLFLVSVLPSQNSLNPQP